MSSADDPPGRVRVGDVAVGVREMGTGPVILLLHGLPTSGLLWTDVARRLAPRARCIAPDLLGAPGTGLYHLGGNAPGVPGSTAGGAFPPKPPLLSHAAQAAMLVGLLDALGIDSVAVAGHCLGAQVALWLAADQPERVSRLVLLAPGWGADLPFPVLGSLADSVAAAGVLDEPQVQDAHRGAWSGRAGLPPGRIEGFVGRYLRDPEARALYRQALLAERPRAAELVAARERLCAVRAPTVLVIGAHDTVADRNALSQMRREVTAVTELVVLPGAGHFLPLEVPDRVADVVARAALA